MAEVVTIARPYAEAIARLAKEHNSWGSWSAVLGMAASVATEPQVAELIGNPGVPAERVADVVIAVCGSKLDEQGANFVKLLAENKRLVVLPEIARLFEEIRSEAEGMLEARVATPFPLSEAQMTSLVAKLEAKYGRKVTASQEEDASLIGGVVITVGDEVLDASVRTKLAEMAVTLKG